MWLVGLLVALFAAEWLLLWFAIQRVPPEQLPLAVVIVAVVTFVVGSATVYFRIQRRMR